MSGSSSTDTATTTGAGAGKGAGKKAGKSAGEEKPSVYNITVNSTGKSGDAIDGAADAMGAPSTKKKAS
jgi:hypothetical protein